jgi:hypothetical protein
MQMLGVRGMTIGAALTFGAVWWWATRGTESAAEGSARLRETPASHADAFPANALVATAVRDDPAVALSPGENLPADSRRESDLRFQGYVNDKYRFLLQGAGHSPRGADDLRAALLERERVMVAINTARQSSDEAEKAALPGREQQLAALDQRISQSLPAGDIAAFDLLKDSHIEQFQIDDYAQGISNVAPLDDQAKRAILFSKLETRQRFRLVLEQSGLLRSDLPESQRRAVLGDLTRALTESRDTFLQEARQRLTDDEQYSLLANYENGEYRAELEKLRQMAGG